MERRYLNSIIIIELLVRFLFQKYKIFQLLRGHIHTPFPRKRTFDPNALVRESSKNVKNRSVQSASNSSSYPHPKQVSIFTSMVISYALIKTNNIWLCEN